MREIRLYMLAVACLACLASIARTIAENFNVRGWMICAENFAFDVASRWSNSSW